ncbi:MAG: hypothetical protein QM669_08025 [Siphonobacter sp.]
MRTNSKKIFFRVFAFLLSLYVLGWITEKILDFSIRQNYDFKPSMAASGKNTFEVLFLGPSRVDYMLDPAIIRAKTHLNCYDFGLNGNSIEHQLAMFKLWLHYSPKPKYVFLEATPEYLGTPVRGYYDFSFVPFLDEAFGRSFLENKNQKVLNTRHIPLLKYAYFNSILVPEAFVGLGLWLSGGGREWEAKSGYIPTPYVHFDETFDNTRKQNPDGFTLQVSSKQLQFYQKFLALAKSNGIVPVVYEAPILKEYSDMHANRSQCLAQLDSLCAVNQVPFWKFDDQAITRSRAYFFNATHLNQAGTELFSKQLADRMIKANIMAK